MIDNFTLISVALGAGLLAMPAVADSQLTFSVDRHFNEKSGEDLYHAICQDCHMSQAQGAQGAGTYPALTENPKLAAAAYPIFMVANGLGGMPSFKAYLDDDQIATVVNYVRSNFGNHYPDVVSALDVKEISHR